MESYKNFRFFADVSSIRLACPFPIIPQEPLAASTILLEINRIQFAKFYCPNSAYHSQKVRQTMAIDMVGFGQGEGRDADGLTVSAEFFVFVSAYLDSQYSIIRMFKLGDKSRIIYQRKLEKEVLGVRGAGRLSEGEWKPSQPCTLGIDSRSKMDEEGERCFGDRLIEYEIKAGRRLCAVLYVSFLSFILKGSIEMCYIIFLDFFSFGSEVASDKREHLNLCERGWKRRNGRSQSEIEVLGQLKFWITMINSARGGLN